MVGMTQISSKNMSSRAPELFPSLLRTAYSLRLEMAGGTAFRGEMGAR